MNDIDMERLRPLGLTNALLQRLATFGEPTRAGTRLARITQTQRDWFTLHDGAGEQSARALPRLLQVLDAGGQALVIGDWVLAREAAHGEWWIEQRVEPLTEIARRANDGRRQPLASNVDTALLTMGLDADFNPRRMERYIAMVRACGVAPVVVLTKRDVAPDAQHRFQEMCHRLPATVPVIAVNALSGEARAELAPWLHEGQTLVLLGSSGAGKSTLTNTLADDDLQLTGGVRRGDGRGRHTTTARSMHFCPGGACIIDTPGLRTWRPDADAEALAATFEDVQGLAQHCRFRDCTHQGEPGCAVRGHVEADRLQNWRKLLRDAERAEATPLQRIAQRQKWKAIGKAGTLRSQMKREGYR